MQAFRFSDHDGSIIVIQRQRMVLIAMHNINYIFFVFNHPIHLNCEHIKFMCNNEVISAHFKQLRNLYFVEYLKLFHSPPPPSPPQHSNGTCSKVRPLITSDVMRCKRNRMQRNFVKFNFNSYAKVSLSVLNTENLKFHFQIKIIIIIKKPEYTNFYDFEDGKKIKFTRYALVWNLCNCILFGLID